MWRGCEKLQHISWAKNETFNKYFLIYSRSIIVTQLELKKLVLYVNKTLFHKAWINKFANHTPKQGHETKITVSFMCWFDNVKNSELLVPHTQASFCLHEKFRRSSFGLMAGLSRKMAWKLHVFKNFTHTGLIYRFFGNFQYFFTD